MKFQRKLSNGKWIDEANTEKFLALALAREPFTASISNRKPMATCQQIAEFLAAGNTLRYGDDWYAEIRDADGWQPSSTPKPYRIKMVELTRCDCGHVIESAQVMNTGRGTACPACYDRMSD